MKVSHQNHTRILATTIFLTFSLCVLAQNAHSVSVADNFSERAGVSFQGAVQPTLKPDCDLEFPLKADSDVRHKTCLNKIRATLIEKANQTPDEHFIILIDGHRDSKGQEGQALSRSRAEKVAEYLVNNPAGAIDAAFIKIRDLNDVCPPERSDKHNRRVQVWVVPEGTELLSSPPKCPPGSKEKPASGSAGPSHLSQVVPEAGKR